MLFEHFQKCQFYHFPGKPVPMIHYTLSEEIFPNSQSKYPLVHLETISSTLVNRAHSSSSDFFFLVKDPGMVHTKFPQGQCSQGTKMCTQAEGYRTVSADTTNIAMEIS